MAGGSIKGLPMPDHPVLRQVAEQMERFDRVAQIVDRSWRFVYISSEMYRGITGGTVVPEMYEMGHVRRSFELDFATNTRESQREWWRTNAPYMRYTLEPGTPEFDNAFGPNAERARSIEPREPPPVWGVESTFESSLIGGGLQYLMAFRINDRDGSLAGVVEIAWPALSGRLTWLLSQGDPGMWERMGSMRRPHRCPSALLFCDIEGSGEISRTLSSRAYFDLIRSVTTKIDHAVAARGGIVGRHAGDGASAFFAATDFDGSNSAACRAAIEAMRSIRDSVSAIEFAGERIALNFGVHWGGTIVMGQVSDGGRLEVTALGDEVNETARIQDAARGGTALASKDLVERLSIDDSSILGIDPDSISYTPLGRLEGVSDKTLRDAATIPVAEL